MRIISICLFVEIGSAPAFIASNEMIIMLLLRFSFEIDTFRSTVPGSDKEIIGNRNTENVFISSEITFLFDGEKDFQELSLLLSSCLT